MMDIKEMFDNNILAKRRKAREEQLPAETRKRLEQITGVNFRGTELQVIKRKRKSPSVGDIFQVNPRDDIFFYGLVVNKIVADIVWGVDRLVVMIFQEDVNIRECINRGIKKEDLLIAPQILTKSYWSQGYFYNVDHIDYDFHIDNYGFYKISTGKFVDDYGNELPVQKEPELLEGYGTDTIDAVGYLITYELIIAGKI